MTRVSRTVWSATDRAFTLGRLYAESQHRRKENKTEPGPRGFYSMTEALADLDEINQKLTAKLERKYKRVGAVVTPKGEQK